MVRALLRTDTGGAAGLNTIRIGRISTDSLRKFREPREPEYSRPVFRRQIFDRATSQFQPQTTDPAPRFPGKDRRLARAGA